MLWCSMPIRHCLIENMAKQQFLQRFDLEPWEQMTMCVAPHRLAASPLPPLSVTTAVGTGGPLALQNLEPCFSQHF